MQPEPRVDDLLLALAEESPDGLLVVSPDGRMTFQNARFRQVWDFPEDVVDGGDDDSALAAATERVADPDAFIAQVRRLYAERAPSHDEVVLRDGRTLDRYGAPLYDGSGAYVGYAWYFRDVTASKRAEAEQRTLAATLQASLLPPRPPEVPGMEVATRYHPADSAIQVGGDFFDVFRVRVNDWGLVLGDVCGKGARAAALTALSRYTLRAAAVHNFSPAAVLEELNVSLLADAVPEADDAFCAAVFARLELDTCGAWVTLASGGHPRPVVVRRVGWIDVRGHPGTPLGMFATPTVVDDRVGLGPGDALVFCTDGITEARDATGEMFGDEALPTLLVGSAGLPAETIADRVLRGALAFAGGHTHDDVALLVVRVPEEAREDALSRLSAAIGRPADDLPLPGYPVGDADPDLWSARSAPPREARIVLASEPASVPAVRRFLHGLLHSWRMGELSGGDVELLATELATNALRHARSPFTVIVRYDGEVLRVEVGDGSRALPRLLSVGPDETGGRGLFLVETLASAWGVAPTVEGKRVWFDVPVPPDGGL